MRVVNDDHGLPRLGDAQIALMRASHAYGGIYDALANHIVQSMGNLDGYHSKEKLRSSVWTLLTCLNRCRTTRA
jgi:hypothetical protein